MGGIIQWSIIALPLLEVAAVLRQRGVDVVEDTRPRPKAILTTMVTPTDEMPIDIMLEHQIRMITSSRDNLVEVTVLENRPPWVDKKSPHEMMLSRFRRTYNNTGFVQVKTVRYGNYQDQGYLGQFFEVLDSRGDTSTGSNSSSSSSLENDEGEKGASWFVGMLHFLELCRDAKMEVEFCIFVDPRVFVYRNKEMGMLELASLLFSQDHEAIVFGSSDYCDFSKGASGLCAPERPASLDSRLFVVHRRRLMQALPLQVKQEDMDDGFLNVFVKGISKKGAKPVKKMACGHAFAIAPFHIKFSCKGNHQMGIVQHTKNMAAEANVKSLSAAAGFSEANYVAFNNNAVAGLPLFIERFEKGRFPAPKYLESVTNKCQDMCPSKERIMEGYAW